MEPLDQGAGAGVLIAALQWVEGLLLGSLALAVSTIAVAVFGLMMLSGRLDYRAGARIVLGCFILFGARSIATGIQAASDGLGDGGTAYSSPAPLAAVALPPALPPPAGPAPVSDPYAAASAPTAGSCCD